MNRRADTGETAASIQRRSDDYTLQRVMPLLRSGKSLFFVRKLGKYYITDAAGSPTAGGISPAGITRYEREGTLREVGVYRYGLPGDQLDARAAEKR